METKLTKKVQVDVEILTDKGLFRDALYFNEGEVPSQTELEVEAQERVNKWLIAVNTQPKEVVETEETLALKIEQAEEAKVRLDEEYAKLEAEIVDFTARKIALKTEPVKIIEKEILDRK